MITSLASLSVTGWIDIGPHGECDNPELASWFDAVGRRGLTMSLVSGGGGYSSQGDQVRVSVGIDDGTAPEWRDCGAPNPDSRYVSNSLTVLDGELYAATTDAASPDGYAHVYRYLGGQNWLDLGRPDGVDARGIGPMVAHDGTLYVAAWTYDWTVVDSLPLSPVHAYRLSADGSWEDLGAIGGAKRIFGMASYRGEVYASADDDHVYRYCKGKWDAVGALPSYPHPMHVFGDRLWVGTVDPGELWSYDGTQWRPHGNPASHADEASQLHSFARPRGHLAVGSWPFGHVHYLDDGKWISMGGPAGATEVNGLQQYNGMLYAGTLPYAELSRYDAALGWTTIRRFNDLGDGVAADIAASGWRSRQDMAVMESAGNSAPGDDSMRQWGRVTSMVEHDGRLFLSTGNSTSSYDDCPGKVSLGKVFAMSAGTVATSPQVLSAGRHHIAAVWDGARLSLYVDGCLVADASGAVHGPIAMPNRSERRDGNVVDAQWFERALLAFDVEKLCAKGTIG